MALFCAFLGWCGVVSLLLAVWSLAMAWGRRQERTLPTQDDAP